MIASSVDVVRNDGGKYDPMNEAYLRRFRREQRVVDALERRSIRSLLSMIPSGAAARTLDVPSGYGRVAIDLKAVSPSIVLADRSSEILGLIAPGLEGHPRVCCDVRFLPFKNDAFDFINVIRLWHHFRDPELRRSALSELRRVSTRFALLSYYRNSGLHAWSRRIMSRFRKRVQINMMKPSLFEAEAKAGGFNVRSQKKVLPLVHAQTVALLERAPSE